VGVRICRDDIYIEGQMEIVGDEEIALAGRDVECAVVLGLNQGWKNDWAVWR
jgi:hypothetical protein